MAGIMAAALVLSFLRWLVGAKKQKPPVCAFGPPQKPWWQK
jgi:hypothetical protein